MFSYFHPLSLKDKENEIKFHQEKLEVMKEKSAQMEKEGFFDFERINDDVVRFIRRYWSSYRKNNDGWVCINWVEIYHHSSYMYICIYVYVYMCICVYVYMCICVYVYMYICIYVYMSIYVYICLYVYMSICLYVYICIYIYVYMYMYICITLQNIHL